MLLGRCTTNVNLWFMLLHTHFCSPMEPHKTLLQVSLPNDWAYLIVKLRHHCLWPTLPFLRVISISLYLGVYSHKIYTSVPQKREVNHFYFCIIKYIVLQILIHTILFSTYTMAWKTISILSWCILQISHVWKYFIIRVFMNKMLSFANVKKKIHLKEMSRAEINLSPEQNKRSQWPWFRIPYKCSVPLHP